jgi:hypothetical protein
MRMQSYWTMQATKILAKCKLSFIQHCLWTASHSLLSFVVASKEAGANNSASVLFRSYKNPLEMSDFPDIAIWQAARATSAAPTYFEPLRIGKVGFVDGGMQANNPLGWYVALITSLFVQSNLHRVWNEMLSVYGAARTTNCFLSIGTGVPLTETLSEFTVPKATTVSSIATNSELPNILFRSLINAFAPAGMIKKYWRLNVGDGLPDWVKDGDVYKWKLTGKRKEGDTGDLDDVAALANTEKAAQAYIDSTAGAQMISDVGTALVK